MTVALACVPHPPQLLDRLAHVRVAVDIDEGDLGISGETANTVTKPFPGDEDRAADVEPERVVLERRAVPVSHQEADQPFVRLVELRFRRANETRARWQPRGRRPGHRRAGRSRDRGHRLHPRVSHRRSRERRTLARLPDVPGLRQPRRSRHSQDDDSHRYLRLVVPDVAARLLPRRPAAGEFLRFYAERFDTVELNATGYRLPSEDQFRRWAETVPDGFRFAVKLPLTRLDRVTPFLERVAALGDRLGPVRVVVEAARTRASSRSSRAPRRREPSWRGTSGTSRGRTAEPRVSCASTIRTPSRSAT